MSARSDIAPESSMIPKSTPDAATHSGQSGATYPERQKLTPKSVAAGLSASEIENSRNETLPPPTTTSSASSSLNDQSRKRLSREVDVDDEEDERHTRHAKRPRLTEETRVGFAKEPVTTVNSKFSRL